jgi:hypothetical protein
MPMHYADMCDEARAFMIEEVELDGDNLYLSSYFTDAGRAAWKGLLLEACQRGDDQSLAQQLRGGGYIRAFTQRNTKKGVIQVRVPYDAHETIADSNFSRFYLRAVCRLAARRGVTDLIGYRAMEVAQPRPGSQEKINAAFDAARMLDDLRATMDRNPALGMPPGVGSGILARLP